MQRKDIILTKDGSHTLYSDTFQEHYHSQHGALSESQHIFIKSGLESIHANEISALEVGFGTGLNALLSWIYAEQHQVKISYHSIELYPVAPDVWSQINYPDATGHADKFQWLHQATWDETIALSPSFTLHKIYGSVSEKDLAPSSVDAIFFDAFSPEKQPELWTAGIFKKMYDSLSDGGILVTYCSKSMVRRNMEEAGFAVEKLQGPHGKRDIVRARKTNHL